MNKINKSIEQITAFEPKRGYYVAFSGGKDSIVIYDLVKKANVKYDVHNSITTIDPKELNVFLREKYPEVKRHKPKKNMFQLVEEKKALPTRLGRFCCEHLKEFGGHNRVVVTGIRKEESNKRADRKLIEYNEKQNKVLFNPILDWLEWEVWEYIEINNLEYPSLYDGGYSRIGCVACPMAGVKQMKKDLIKYPQIKRAYTKAVGKSIKQGGFKRFKEKGFDEYDIMEWWVSGYSVSDFFALKRQINLF